MPIRAVDLTHEPGTIIQVCAGCGAEHEIRLDRGAVETKAGPFVLGDGVTLELAVDGLDAHVVVQFGASDVADLGAATPAEVKARIESSAGEVAVRLYSGRAVIESRTTGPSSRVEVRGGTAREALGFHVDGRQAWAPGRPVLGFARGEVTEPDAILLRQCGCGTHEMLSRTWDQAAVHASSKAYAHRRLVNGLAQYLRSRGWVDDAVREQIDAETAEPPEQTALREGTRTSL